MSVRIVCFGDSLGTCGGEYGTYPELLQREMLDCQIVNCSVAGETLAGARVRLQQEVLSLKPDILVVELGANDFWLRNRSLADMKNDYEYIVSSARRADVEVIIASCFGASLPCSKNKIDWHKTNLSLAECSVGIAVIEADLAERYQCLYIPDIQVDIRPAGKKPFWASDNHPSAAGNKLVAARIKYQAMKAIEKLDRA